MGIKITRANLLVYFRKIGSKLHFFLEIGTRELHHGSMNTIKCLAAVILLGNSHPLHAAQFSLLPKRPGDTYAIAVDLSKGGEIVVGTVRNQVSGISHGHAVAWRRSTTGYSLAVLDNSDENSAANAVSEDGSVIVGWIYKDGRQVAARWTNGVIDLIGDAEDQDHQSEAVAVSDDGSVIACNRSKNAEVDVVVFSETEGVKLLENSGNEYPMATCISGDGKIVGGHRRRNGEISAVIWDSAGAVSMPEGSKKASVMALSRDGGVIAGYAQTQNSEGSTYTDAEAMLWDASGGFKEMGDLPGWMFSSDIVSCDASGNVLVGHAAVKEGHISAIWVKNVGPLGFGDYLTQQYGLNVPRFGLENVCVSSGGKQFAGSVSNDVLSTDAWIVDAESPKKPEIVVAQPSRSELKDGKTAKSFGLCTVKVLGAKKTFTIRNTGNAKLSNLSVSIRGNNASSFLITSLRVNSLPPGAKTTFDVVFKPKVKGNQSASLRIKSNDADENPFDIKLSGTGIPRKKK